MQNRDELSHAWPFEPLRVNVINVHGYNAEVQQHLLSGLRGNTEPGHFKTCTDLFQEHATHIHTVAQEYYGAYFLPFVANLINFWLIITSYCANLVEKAAGLPAAM